MSQDYLNRRKVRGLTKLGRMVSEDPDIDNLLSNLSPEELEEVEKEVMKVPGPDPSEITLVDQTDSQSANNSRAAKSGAASNDSRRSLQRNVSVEGDQKESRKQEYLRKMGWSQERKEDGLQRQDSVSCSRDNKMDTRNSRGSAASSSPTPTSDGPKEEQSGAGSTHRWRREEDRGAGSKADKTSDAKLNEKKDAKESSSKTKQMISRMEEKKQKDESREKEKKEEGRRRDDSKMKGLISRMEEKREKEENKEKGKREEVRRSVDSKTRGLVSRLEEKKSQSQTQSELDKQQEKKKDKTDGQAKGTKDEGREKVGEKDEEEKNKGGVENEVKEKDEGMKVSANGEEEKRSTPTKERGKEEEKVEEEKVAMETPKQQEEAEVVENCVAEPKTAKPKTKTKEEEEEEESSSMFDETLEKVRKNDPDMTELNVNNSEVIKPKTLIQFAEALRDNTHIKAFALANCRADDHVAYAIAGTLRVNTALTSVNLDSNLLTSKGIMSLVQALQHNSTLTELRFHNQRHICGGKSEMEMTKLLKENTTLLKLGYHFELAGPRMAMTNILSRNMDRQRQRRLQEQKQAQAQAQANGDQKGALEVPKAKGAFRSPKASPKPSPQPSPMPSPKMAARTGKGGPPAPPPPPPPGGAPPPPPPPPMLDGDFLKNSLTPVSQRKVEDRTGGRGAAKNSRDQLLASIRGSDIKTLKKVPLPKLLQ